MSKDEMCEILDKTLEPGRRSVIIYTKDYVYCLFSSADLETWTEAVFEFPDSFSKKDLKASIALANLIEELTQGLPGYYADLPVVKDPGEVNKVKEMIKG
ncbi:MAG: hypothetical protein ACXQS8_01255 [Candidatus Helarchaeales archaeon]